jgi:hypothetical protein
MSTQRAMPQAYGASGPPNQMPQRVGPPGGIGIGNMAPQGMAPPMSQGAPGMAPPMPQGMPGAGMQGAQPGLQRPPGMPMSGPKMAPQQQQMMAQAQALRGGGGGRY